MKNLQLNILNKIQLKDGQRTQIDISPKRQTDGQHTHEKLLNITTNQGNAGQNHNEVSLYTC